MEIWTYGYVFICTAIGMDTDVHTYEGMKESLLHRCMPKNMCIDRLIV